MEVALSRRRTVGDLYAGLIADLKAEMEGNNTQKCSKYEAFEVHVKMICTVKSEVSSEEDKYFEIIAIPCIISSKPSVLFIVRDVTHFNQIKFLKLLN